MSTTIITGNGQETLNIEAQLLENNAQALRAFSSSGPIGVAAHSAAGYAELSASHARKGETFQFFRWKKRFEDALMFLRLVCAVSDSKGQEDAWLPIGGKQT